MTRPRLVDLDRGLAPGLVAVMLFVFMAVTVLTADGSGPLEFVFTDVTGFADASSVEGIGYALVGEPATAAAEDADAATTAVYKNTESFLLALVLVALVLDAALDGALMLASREDDE
jgi:NADH-quinone oxidoreductase subunit J